MPCWDAWKVGPNVREVVDLKKLDTVESKPKGANDTWYTRLKGTFNTSTATTPLYAIMIARCTGYDEYTSQSSSQSLGNGHRYTAYTVFVRSGEQAWELRKRYSDFLRLHEELRSRLPTVAAFPFPNKSKIYTFAKFTKDRRREGFDDYLRLLATLKPPPPELLHFLGLASSEGADDGHSSSSSHHGHNDQGLRRRRAGESEGHNERYMEASSSSSGHAASKQRHAPSLSHASGSDDQMHSNMRRSLREGASSSSSSSSSSALKSSAALVAGAGAGLVAFFLRALQGGQPLFDPTRFFGGLFSSDTSSSVGVSGGWGPCVTVLAVWSILYQALVVYG